MGKKVGALALSFMIATATLTGGNAHAATGCMIALTFDDGPAQYTDQIVDTLVAHGARATFFMVGTQVQRFPGAAQHVVAAGNQPGNHSWQHDQLTLKSPEGAAADVRHAEDLITATTGVAPQVLRPPYGETNDAIVRAIGMPEILWTDDSLDYATHNTESTFRNVTNSARCGNIVLMHDIHESTAAAVPRILDNLQSRDFQMVTVDTLLAGTPPLGRYYHQ